MNRSIKRLAGWRELEDYDPEQALEILVEEKVNAVMEPLLKKLDDMGVVATDERQFRRRLIDQIVNWFESSIPIGELNKRSSFGMKKLPSEFSKLTPDPRGSYYDNVYCKGCGELKPTKQYFYQPDGYNLTSTTYFCDECVKEYDFPDMDVDFHKNNIEEDESVFGVESSKVSSFKRRAMIGKIATGFTPEQTQKYLAWIKANTTDKGLLAANPMTAMGLVKEFGKELGKTYEEQIWYAVQIVDQYTKSAGKKLAGTWNIPTEAQCIQALMDLESYEKKWDSVVGVDDFWDIIDEAITWLEDYKMNRFMSFEDIRLPPAPGD